MGRLIRQAERRGFREFRRWRDCLAQPPQAGPSPTKGCQGFRGLRKKSFESGFESPVLGRGLQ